MGDRERVGSIAYHLDLPPELAKLHNVFHISMLRKCEGDSFHVVPQSVELKDDMTYLERLVQILEYKEQILLNKSIPLVKVLWRSRATEYATWEIEDSMRKQHPYLFDHGK